MKQFCQKDLVFRYSGVGMEPTLSKNCLLGINTSKDSNKLVPISSGEIYAIYSAVEGIIFRRLIQDLERDIYLLCFEDKKLPTTRLPSATLQKEIVGKLSWVLHII